MQSLDEVLRNKLQNSGRESRSSAVELRRSISSVGFAFNKMIYDTSRYLDRCLRHRNYHYQGAHKAPGRHLYTARSGRWCVLRARGIERTHPGEYIGGTRGAYIGFLFCPSPRRSGYSSTLSIYNLFDQHDRAKASYSVPEWITIRRPMLWMVSLR